MGAPGDVVMAVITRLGRRGGDQSTSRQRCVLSIIMSITASSFQMTSFVHKELIIFLIKATANRMIEMMISPRDKTTWWFKLGHCGEYFIRG
jgi:hypothetical protein